MQKLAGKKSHVTHSEIVLQSRVMETLRRCWTRFFSFTPVVPPSSRRQVIVRAGYGLRISSEIGSLVQTATYVYLLVPNDKHEESGNNFLSTTSRVAVPRKEIHIAAIVKWAARCRWAAAGKFTILAVNLPLTLPRRRAVGSTTMGKAKIINGKNGSETSRRRFFFFFFRLSPFPFLFLSFLFLLPQWQSINNSYVN